MYIPGIDAVRPVLEFLGTPFVALIIAVLLAMYFLGTRQGYDGEQLKKILDRSLRPTGQILLVITGGGIIRWVLPVSYTHLDVYKRQQQIIVEKTAYP